MTHATHILEVAIGLGLAGLLAWRLWNLPKALKAAGVEMQALGSIQPLSTQPASVPWVVATVGPTATTASLASNYYDPTKTTVVQTFNEFGFITSPMPAPVNPKVNAVPLTNIDICNWIGHAVPATALATTCPRCGSTI